MDTTILSDPYIWVVDDVIPKDKCKEIIKRFKADKRHHQGVTAAGVNKVVKNSKDLFISDFANWADIDELFCDLIRFLIQNYTTHLQNAGILHSFVDNSPIYLIPPITELKDTGYQIQETKPGKGYTWHSDYTVKRVLTYILYLNDVEEGWTQFYNGDQVAPRAGRCLIFPAQWTYIHQGYPPKQTKYLMTGWLHSDN